MIAAVRPAPRFALLWLFGAVLLWFFYRQGVAAMRYPDPDDLLRLQEVRDWIGGQSWFDVTQYRINPPAGVAMHWSRLIDVPLAAVMLVLRPLLGAAGAERVAVVVVPLLTYGAMLALLIPLSDRLGGRPAAWAAGLMLPFDPGALATARPLRIDHHGWQAVCGLAMALLVVTRHSVVAAALAGLAAALWADISLEALPFAAAVGALLGWRWMRDPDRARWQFTAYLCALAIGSLVIGLAVHGAGLFAYGWCDAVSSIHLLLFSVAAAGVGVLARLRPATRILRFVGLVAIGAVLMLVYRQAAPQCAAGPFGGLDPLVYRLWYLNVMEGRPVWVQPLSAAAFAIAFPLVGLAAGGVLLRRMAGEARQRWLDLLWLLVAATVIAMLLVRAGTLANLLALPFVALLTAWLLQRIAGWSSSPTRVAGSVGAVLMLQPMLPTMAAALIAPGTPVSREVDCDDIANLAALDALAPALILTPLDIGPAVIVGSHHGVLATGHHRNAAGMKDVIDLFVGREGQARSIARRHGAGYLLICPARGELSAYRQVAPDGLAARLAQGRAPPWLAPVRLPGLAEARLWRIVG